MCKADEKTKSTEPDREWYYLGVYLTLALVCCADQVFSMLMAFYPAVVEDKGLSPTLTGVLFGSFAFFSVVANIFATTLTKKYGSSRTLTISTFVLALSVLAYAFTDMVEELNLYFTVCFLLRTVQGLTSGCIEVAALGILMRSVPQEKAGDTVGWLESARALGMIGGPLVGSSIYSSFGYSGPFLFSAMLVGGIGVVMVTTGFSSNKSNESTSTGTSTTMRIVKLPVIGACLCTMLLCSAAITFFEPTLEPFLNRAPYKLSDVHVAIIYTTAIISFGVGAGVSGDITSRLGNVPTLTYSLLVTALGFFIAAPPETFTGPLSIFAFLYAEKYVIHQMILALFLIGGGVGISVAPYSKILIDEAANIGLSVDASSDAISSITAIAFSVGAAIGPFSSGILVDNMGFRKSCSLFGYVCGIAGIIILYYIGGVVAKQKLTQTDEKNETGQLLNNANEKTYDSILV